MPITSTSSANPMVSPTSVANQPAAPNPIVPTNSLGALVSNQSNQLPSLNPTGTTTAPAVITANSATNVVNNAQTSVNNKVSEGAAINAVKNGPLTTTYDANGNMIKTGGVFPNGSTYIQTFPKGSPGYIENPVDVAKRASDKLAADKLASENALRDAANGGSQNPSLTPTPSLTYNNPSNITPPGNLDPTTQDGQAEWYNQDPQGFSTWAKDQGISSDNLFQVKVLAGNQQLQSLQAQGNNALNQYLSGTFPLTASQQAQVDGLRNMWEGTISAQRNANDTYVSASAMASARQGGEYDPLGSLAQAQRAIQTGLDRITVFQGAEAAAINNMIQGFQDKDYKAVTDNLTLQAGLTDKITANLKTVNDAIVKAKDAAQAQQNRIEDKQYEQVTKPINDVAAEAAKNGAPQDIQDKINTAKNVKDAIAAAGDYLQTGTGTLGDYLQYKRDSERKGLVPMEYTDYKDLQDQKEQQRKLNQIYAQAAATASANATESDKVQQKLENQYSTKLKVLFSNRTGSLGIENAKVSQANHLNSLAEQYYDPKTGNYNIPTAQYSEFVLGLASLISNSGTSTEGEVKDLQALTAKGDVNKLAQYLSGNPQNGNTQAMIKNMLDSVDRQAQTAINNREAAFQQLSDQAPTDLNPARKAKLDQSFTDALNYTGQDRVAKGALDTYVKMAGRSPLPEPITASDGSVIKNTGELVATLLSIPGATNQGVYQYMKDNNYIK